MQGSSGSSIEARVVVYNLFQDPILKGLLELPYVLLSCLNVRLYWYLLIVVVDLIRLNGGSNSCEET